MDNMARQPLPVGVSQGPQLHPDTAFPPAELQVSDKTTWAALSEEFVLFTPAFLYLTTPLPVDPFVAYGQDKNIVLHPGYLRSNKPLFLGLMHPNGDLSYCFTLLTLPKPEWEPFKSWLGTAAWNDSQRGLIRRLRFQDIYVRDEPRTDGNPASREIHRVPVVAWCIETNRGSFYFKEPAPDDILRRPMGFFDRAMIYADTVKFAEALKADSPNPYNVQGI